MTSAPQPLPRFIPTLTQIVEHPSALASQSKPDTSAMFASVWQQIEPVLKRRVEEEIEQMIQLALAEKSAEIQNLLHDEMRLLIQQTVREALLDEKNQPRI